MKIAVINSELERGGAARAAATITKAFNESGKAQARLFHCGDRSNRGPFVGLRRYGSRQINAGILRLMGSEWTLDFGVAKAILDQCIDTDILHLHNLHGYFLDYKTLVASWNDRPIVWTWHDTWGATGRCAFAAQCDRWKTGCEICPNKGFYPAAWIDHASREYRLKSELFIKNNNIWITTPSEWVRDVAIERGYAENRVCVIRNPIDNQFLSCRGRDEARRALNLPYEDFIALFIASNCADPRKGYVDFAEALEETSVTGIAVGEFPRIASQRIIHTGRVLDQNQLGIYYSAADLMIIPSYDDNYPNTVIEAISCGTPVLGYATGGIPSQTDAPFCGVVRKGDKDALIKEIQRRVRNGNKSPEMAASLKEHGTRHWESKRIATQFLNLFERAMAR